MSLSSVLFLRSPLLTSGLCYMKPYCLSFCRKLTSIVSRIKTSHLFCFEEFQSFQAVFFKMALNPRNNCKYLLLKMSFSKDFTLEALVLLRLYFLNLVQGFPKIGNTNFRVTKYLQVEGNCVIVKRLRKSRNLNDFDLIFPAHKLYVLSIFVCTLIFIMCFLLLFPMCVCLFEK